MEIAAWIMLPKAYLIISIIVWFAVEDGSVCLITPSAVAVIAGDNVSLTCTTDTFVIAWARGITYNNASVVFQAASSSGGRTIPKIVVDGYLANDSVEGQVVLIMNSASTIQADRYYCFCSASPPSYSATSVTVLASKSTFSITSQITDRGQVNMTCNISFSGTADASAMITNIYGQVVAQKREPGSYLTSTDLRIINLYYSTTANSSIIQTYTCQINLTDNSVPLYSEQMMSSVQWVPVQKVQINPVDKSRCSSGSKCAINQAINCTAEGNPYPAMFQWTVVLNGSQLDKTRIGQLLTLSSTGNYTIQCTALNMIGGITYNGASEYFKTEVTVDGPPTPQPDTTEDQNNSPLIVGIVVGIGGGIIVIVLTIVIFLFCKRKKREQKKVEVYTTLDVQRSVPLGMPQQLYTDLHTSPIIFELQNDHSVVSETYESVIVD